MKVKNPMVKKLLEKYKEIYLLNRISAVLGWDLNVNLPPKAGQGRGDQLAYLSAALSDKWQDPEFKRLLTKATDELKNLGTEERAVVRNLNWAAKYYHRVPKKVIVDFTKATSTGFLAWQSAKKNNKFSEFLPHLKKIATLNRITADHIGYEKNPYDALLDIFEPGLTTDTCKKVFGKLQPELTNVIKKIKKSKNFSAEDSLGEGTTFPVDVQEKLTLFALRKIGYDFDAGRQDVSSHPFTDTLGRFDERITNRYKPEDFRESLMVAMHEGGHALYDLGVKEEYAETPLDGGVSLGIHESQSRFWENQVGRSEAFLKFMTPIFHAFYPNELNNFGPEDFFRTFNQVRPSFIRVEADEVTYNLHIALRFELEEAIVNDKIKLEKLPEIWRAKMKEYLGVVPATDSEGVLQDIHWSHGMMGYFPTYTLGNLYAAQFTNTMKKTIDVEAMVEKADLGTILTWLRTNIHQYGAALWPDELVKKITDEELNPKYFLNYIKEKYSKIYSVKL